ncbi:MAG: tetratricopeptide repeat protein [Candidatus Peregrinibacteria bacterium]
MKIPARIGLPILFAILCTAGVLTLLWWQLTVTTRALVQQQNAPAPPDATRSAAPSPALLAPLSDSQDSSLLHLRQGDIVALRGEWSAAQDEYQKAVDAGGGLTALRKLALAQLQRRDMEGLRATIRAMKAQGARPEDTTLIENIVLLRTGELNTAKARLAQEPDSPQKHYVLSLLAIIEGDHAAAKVELTKTADGWEPVLRTNARKLLAAYNEFAQFPEGSDLHRITLLARALAEVQECELALPLLAQVTKQKDDYPSAWIVQGYCELTTERPEQALVSLERAYNLVPSKPEIQYFLGRAHAQLKDHDTAITFLTYALQNGFAPTSEVRRLIAQESLVKNDGSGALLQYAAMTQEKDATFEAFQGYVQTALTYGRKAEAYAFAREATVRFPDSAEAFDLLGWAAMENGQNEEAKNAFTKALSIDPFLLSAKERMGKLR